jgi:SpoIID/LytB domain protein
VNHQAEPQLEVGVLRSTERVTFDVHEGYEWPDGAPLKPGRYEAVLESHGSGQPGLVRVLTDNLEVRVPEFVARSKNAGETSFAASNVQIGIGFHWQQTERQEFKGNLKVFPDAENQLVLVNEIGLESYLESVISSEMSDQANVELLKAHAVISRSWAMAQLIGRQSESKRSKSDSEARGIDDGGGVIWRWYDRENHGEFDFCADDHCQRYQGVTKAATLNASLAVKETRGQVLVFDGRVCDTRFSKSCGGMTEEFATAWADIEIPYLAARFDGDTVPLSFGLPLSKEENARLWIEGSPPAFCNSHDQAVLDRILPDFDRATSDFYRWTIEIGQDELQQILLEKLGLAGQLGAIKALVPLKRGPSGRIIKLRIEGTAGTLEIGKELEIRRALSKSHLYSSAFVVDTAEKAGNIPERFVLKGAGWGHGVGLCQIGAAVMADRGYRFAEILEHYFQSAELQRVYE